MNISGLLARPFAFKTARYAAVSAALYLVVVASMWTLVERISVPEKIAYGITLAAVYPLNYVLNIHFVFNSENNKRTRLSYLGYLIANYLVTNLVFWMLSAFNIYYLYSSVLAMAVLIPARFFAQYLFVFVRKP